MVDILIPNAIYDTTSRNIALKGMQPHDELVLLLKNEILTDVVLRARDFTVRAHGVVLAARSRCEIVLVIATHT